MADLLPCVQFGHRGPDLSELPILKLQIGGVSTCHRSPSPFIHLRTDQCSAFWLSRSEYRFNPEMISRVNVLAIIFPPAG